VYKNFFKPLLDFIVAFIGLAVISPVFLVVVVILLFQNNGRPFFFQTRPGKNQIAFKIIKFKTMTDEKDNQGNLLPDVERTTRVGNVIRQLSIDEIPQLINILKGDMSLVGPRPLLFKYIPMYNADQMRRHDVKPGITGWAQVNGRNSISWTDKFKFDTYYVDHVSLSLDIKILFMTFLKVIKREGINQSEDRPMQPFNGIN
jgi:undecaprenyl phosphate N,N'-diacetylbacillosamine 1-phosphate transferase